MAYIDLHAHTLYSDGTLTPSALVALAKEKELTAIAITDHDTLDGNAEGLAAGAQVGIEVIPGIEISAKYEPFSLHLLGYYIDSAQSELAAHIARLQDARNERNPKIIKKLQKMGVDIYLEEVIAQTPSRIISRMHIAKTLVAGGWAHSLEEAFQKYLKDGGPAYVSKEILTPKEAIGLIAHAGGVPCLAHPWLLEYNINKENLAEIIQDLVSVGLRGIEVFYGRGNAIGNKYSYETQVQFLLDQAKQHQLKIVGGSDFHGANKPGLELGHAKVDAKWLTALR